MLDGKRGQDHHSLPWIDKGRQIEVKQQENDRHQLKATASNVQERKQILKYFFPHIIMKFVWMRQVKPFLKPMQAISK